MKERNLIRGLTSYSPVCRDVSRPQVSTSAAVQDVIATAQSEIGREDDLRGRRGRQAGRRKGRRGAWPPEISGDSTGEGGGDWGDLPRSPAVAWEVAGLPILLQPPSIEEI